MVGPIRSSAAVIGSRQRSADMLDRFRTVPESGGRAAHVTGGRVIAPGIAFRLQQVGQGWMLKTGKNWGVGFFAASRIDQRYRGSRGCVASGVGRAAGFRILRREQVASKRWSRCPGNDELMRRHAGALVGLEHAVGEGVLLGQLEVGLHIRRVHIAKRQVGRRAIGCALAACHRNQVRTIHLTLPGRIQLAHVEECIVPVAGVVVHGETYFLQCDRIAVRVGSLLGDVRAAIDQRLVLEKIIRSAILLENHHHVLNLP